MLNALELEISELNHLVTSGFADIKEVQFRVRKLMGKVDNLAKILSEKGVEDSGISQNSTVVTNVDVVLNKINFYFKRVSDCINNGDILSLNYAMGVCSLLRESLMSIVQLVMFRRVDAVQM